jgi:hypothetical protein
VRATRRPPKPKPTWATQTQTPADDVVAVQFKGVNVALGEDVRRLDKVLGNFDFYDSMIKYMAACLETFGPFMLFVFTVANKTWRSKAALLGGKKVAVAVTSLAGLVSHLLAQKRLHARGAVLQGGCLVAS